VYLIAGLTKPELQVQNTTSHLKKSRDRFLQTAPAACYGAGTLMTVFTMVTDAPKASTLPLMVVTAATPGLETVIPG
jgi:hypothetical protein